MVTYGGLVLPHVQTIKQQTTRTYLQVSLPYRPFDYKKDLGGQGSAFTVDGYLYSADPVSRAQIAALANGTARILDLQELKLQPFDNVLSQILGTARVQGPANNSSASASSLTVTMAQTPQTGNTLIALVSMNSNSTEHVTSINQTGVSWTKQVAKNWSGQFSVEIWLGIVGPNPGTSVVIHASAAPRAGPTADICEYLGQLVLDQSATNQGTSSVGDSGTTPTRLQARELMIGGITSWNGQETAPSNGFVVLDGNAVNSVMQGYFEKFATAIGTADVTCTFSAGSLNFVGCMATFIIGNAMWVDFTAAAHAGGSPFIFLQTSTDYMYFGGSEKFNKLQFLLSALGNYSPVVLQYSQGSSAWQNLNLNVPYDDFLGYSLNTTLWTLTQGTANVLNSILTLSNYANFYSYPGSRFGGTDPLAPYQTVVFRMSVAQTTSQVEVHPIDNNNDNVLKFIFNNNGTLTLVLSQHPNYVYTTVPGNYDTAMHTYIVTWLPTQVQVYRDGVLLWTVTQTNSIPTLNFGFAVILSDNVSSCAIDYFATLGDTTQFMEENGTITFTPPSDWLQDTVNGISNRFWLRAISPYGVTTAATINQALLNPCFNCILLNPLYTYDVTVWDQTDYELTFQQQENPPVPGLTRGFDPAGFDPNGFD